MPITYAREPTPTAKKESRSHSSKPGMTPYIIGGSIYPQPQVYARLKSTAEAAKLATKDTSGISKAGGYVFGGSSYPAPKVYVRKGKQEKRPTDDTGDSSSWRSSTDSIDALKERR